MYELLNAFGRGIDISDLGFDEHGYCCLAFDDLRLHLEFDETAHSLLIYSYLGTLPSAPQPTLYEALLEGNCFQRQSAGGAIGIDRATGAIVLSRRLETDRLELMAFEQSLADFVNALDHWRTRLAEQTNNAEPATMPSSIPLAHAFMDGFIRG